jgi:hypothetical protein
LARPHTRHALEIAAAADVQDIDGVRQLYRRIGHEGMAGRFETSEARAVGNRVRDELAGLLRGSPTR